MKQTNKQTNRNKIEAKQRKIKTKNQEINQIAVNVLISFSS